MSQHSRTLAEISHLFLSSVRDKQTAGSARPQRKPPTPVQLDLSPEELAVVQHIDHSIDQALAKPATLLLASHFKEHFNDRACQYASHLAKSEDRVGLVIVDRDSIRISCFDHDEGEAADATGSLEETLNELNCDISHWVIATLSPLNLSINTTLLAECTQAGIIEAYKVLKQLSSRPQQLNLAVVEARDLAAADRAHGNLASAAKQFLACDLTMQGAILPAPEISEHLLINCPNSADDLKFLETFFSSPQPLQQIEIEERPVEAVPAPTLVPQRQDDVIEVSTDNDLLTAYLHQSNFIICPFESPIEQVKIAIDSKNNLVLVAEMPEKMSDLAELLESRQWATKNLSLISRAMNCQIASPLQLHVLISNPHDATILRAISATPVEFRTLRWQGKSGVHFSLAA